MTNKTVVCTVCGYVDRVDPFWATKQNILGEDSKYPCPVCTAVDKWEMVDPRLGNEKEEIEKIRRNFKIPEDLHKKILISRRPDLFKSGRWKIRQDMQKFFDISSDEEFVQQVYDPVTGKEMTDDEKLGMDLDLAKKRSDLTPSQQARKIRELKKFGVRIVR